MIVQKLYELGLTEKCISDLMNEIFCCEDFAESSNVYYICDNIFKARYVNSLIQKVEIFQYTKPKYKIYVVTARDVIKNNKGTLDYINANNNKALVITKEIYDTNKVLNNRLLSIIKDSYKCNKVINYFTSH